MTIEINALLLFSMRIQHFFDSKIVCAWRVAAQMLAFIWCFKLHNFNMNLKQFLLNPNWFFFSSQSFFRAQLLMLLLCCVCVSRQAFYNMPPMWTRILWLLLWLLCMVRAWNKNPNGIPYNWFDTQMCK